MSDTIDDYRALREYRKREKGERREDAEDTFEEAKKVATNAGLELRRRSHTHYQLVEPQGGALLNLYPGNRRIYHDRNHPFPYIKISWDDSVPWLMRCVLAAAETVGRGRA